MQIQYFEHFEDLYAEIGFEPVVKEHNFHIFQFGDLKYARNYMPPYRRGFYQITLIQNFGKSFIEINTQKFTNFSDALYFISPNQPYSWYRDYSVDGFVIYFSADFLGWPDERIKDTFSFFDMYEVNLIEVTDQDLYLFRAQCEQLLAEFLQNTSKYRLEILKTMITTLLYKSLELYDAKQQSNRENKTTSLVLRFEKYVDNHYLEFKTVNEYAHMLNVTSNHLSQTIKSQTGKSAKNIIDQRVLVEAKNMLKYSDLTVTEIAYQLGFNEPTHFGRFFKKMSHESPQNFRFGLKPKK